MLKWFRPGVSPQQTPLAMVGAKTGERLLLAGTPDPALAAELARVTGLSGETIVAGLPEGRPAIEEAAQQAGALVEWLEHRSLAAPLPVVSGHADIVVLALDLPSLSPETRASLAADAVRALKPGGRLIVIDGRRRAGLFGGRQPPVLPAESVVPILNTAGLLAARSLSHTDGVTYYEARKSR